MSGCGEGVELTEGGAGVVNIKMGKGGATGAAG